VLTVKIALPGALLPDRRKLINVDAGSFAHLLLPPPAGRVLARREIQLSLAEAQTDCRQVPEVRGVRLAQVMTERNFTPRFPVPSLCNPHSARLAKDNTPILAAITCMRGDVIRGASCCAWSRRRTTAARTGALSLTRQLNLRARHARRIQQVVRPGRRSGGNLPALDSSTSVSLQPVAAD
jgi:hypothetical protein